MTTLTQNVQRGGRYRGVAAAAILFVGVVVAAMPRTLSMFRHAASEAPAPALMPGVGMPGGPQTSADGLQGRVREMEARLQTQPRDLAASVLLADALLRVSRATTDARPAGRAAEVLTAALSDAPGAYDALRLLGAIDLSLHRFRDALDVGQRARDLRPDDAWNYGVIGDAHLELGNYDEAFAAFEQMMQRRPNAAAYARVAYARELTGDVEGALIAMETAFSASPVTDPEAQAWYATQVGELLLRLNRLDDADREFRRAVFLYPQYPLARVGSGKVLAARGDAKGALAIFVDQLSRTPTLDLAARIGDLHRADGRTSEAEHYYQLAEELAGPSATQTEAAVALFLADHDRKVPEAVAIAEAVVRNRSDIASEHALAWAYFKAGMLTKASAAMDRATRTGSRDPLLLAHAATIRDAEARRAAAAQ